MAAACIETGSNDTSHKFSYTFTIVKVASGKTFPQPLLLLGDRGLIDLSSATGLSEKRTFCCLGRSWSVGEAEPEEKGEGLESRARLWLVARLLTLLSERGKLSRLDAPFGFKIDGRDTLSEADEADSLLRRGDHFGLAVDGALGWCCCPGVAAGASAAAASRVLPLFRARCIAFLSWYCLNFVSLAVGLANSLR